jgi:hypothetical protein
VQASLRVERLTTAIAAELEHWRWRPVVEALQALRGVQAIHAVRMVAELGDFSRFESPRKLMGYSASFRAGSLVYPTATDAAASGNRAARW